MIIDEKKIKIIKREHLDSFLTTSNSHNFFNKYGFMEGEDILDCEKEILQELLNNIAKKAPKFGRFYLSVFSTSHNPYYITFIDEDKEKESEVSLKPFCTSRRLNDFTKIEQIYIEKELEPIIEEEIRKMREKLGYKIN
ncbi:MAG: hypothetical protein HQK72_15755 [Desulfamplus sp.]|nr:hypothetical protein [Desulfamplus sp.]